MNFSNSDNISILVDVLKNNNITDFVISPGGTNIPIIRAVQDDSSFNCYSVVDERSAAYVAIGIYLQKKKPVALVCTSAQATRNYIPGLTEAFYKRIPILAITMEKHPRFKYQEYMQAPDQTSLPKDSVKESFELPFVSDINDYYHSLRLVNEAVLELSRNGLGPVQLCVPWLDFPLKNVKPAIKTIRSFRADSISSENLLNKKILIVIGEHLPFSSEEKNAINEFCEKTNSVVYVNHLSNFKNDYSVEGNLFLLTSNFASIKEVAPDIIISIGGQTGDYPFYLAFSRNNLEGIEHWRICDDGKVVDTYDKLTRVYQGSIIEFFNSVNSECLNHSFYELWNNKISGIETNLNVPFSQVSIAQYLHDKIPSNSLMQFSILNSLRIWNMFPLDPSIECYSNVGAFGIDGGMSTLIGQSLVSDKLSFLVIGDLAFFYDMNSLSIRELKENVRVLLVNNNGGIEFKLHGENREEADRFIAAANYHGSAKGWAESCGFDYYAVHNMEELKEITPNFISKSKRPIIVEAFVTDYDESTSYSEIVNKHSPKTAKDSIKEVVKEVLGEDTFKKLKRVIKG